MPEAHLWALLLLAPGLPLLRLFTLLRSYLAAPMRAVDSSPSRALSALLMLGEFR